MQTQGIYNHQRSLALMLSSTKCTCPECKSDIKAKNIKQSVQSGYTYHICNSCYGLIAVTLAA